jgi:hypothetical protein
MTFRRSPLAALAGGAGCLLLAACLSTGEGRPPPLDDFLYPVGLAVSPNGRVLWAANSDFDLAFNGGTILALDLDAVRADEAKVRRDPSDPTLPLAQAPVPAGACPADPPGAIPGTGVRQPATQTCAPPVRTAAYVKNGVVTGAFATRIDYRDGRLFVPTRGDTSLLWIDVPADTGDRSLPSSDKRSPYYFGCGRQGDGACDAAHRAGVVAESIPNVTTYTLPGEPFGLGFSSDASLALVTHQTSGAVSLFRSGVGVGAGERGAPRLDHVLTGLPSGGTDIVELPHDVDAWAGCSTTCGAPPPPTFVTSSRISSSLVRLRYLADDSGASPARPVLAAESTSVVGATPSGFDVRSVVIDTSERVACKALVAPESGARTAADVARDRRRCARLPARLIAASRNPSTLVLAHVGKNTEPDDPAYDPDALTFVRAEPVPAGLARLAIAPIVDRLGLLSAKLFSVSFDLNMVEIHDVESLALERSIRVAQGPFAIAFDPFDPVEVARQRIAPRDVDGRARYRFAYVASFSKSTVQLLDLDASTANGATYGSVVFTLGLPGKPSEKGL